MAISMRRSAFQRLNGISLESRTIQEQKYEVNRVKKLPRRKLRFKHRLHLSPFPSFAISGIKYSNSELYQTQITKRLLCFLSLPVSLRIPAPRRPVSSGTKHRSRCRGQKWERACVAQKKRVRYDSGGGKACHTGAKQQKVPPVERSQNLCLVAEGHLASK